MDTTIGITLTDCAYNNLQYIQSSGNGLPFQKEVPKALKHNIWILAIGNKNTMTTEQVRKDIRGYQKQDRCSDQINFVLAKRDSIPTPTAIEQDWSTFDQMKIVPHHIIDSDAITNQKINNIPLTTPPVQPSLPTSSPVQEDNSSSW